MINLSGAGITIVIVHTHSNQQASTFRCRGKYKRAFDGWLRWQGPQREARQRREKLNKKPEGEDFSFRRESARRSRRHSLRSVVWVLQQREIPPLEYSKREKVWEWTSMGFLLRFCLSLSPIYIISFSHSHTSVHASLRCHCEREAGAGSRHQRVPQQFPTSFDLNIYRCFFSFERQNIISLKAEPWFYVLAEVITCWQQAVLYFKLFLLWFVCFRQSPGIQK